MANKVFEVAKGNRDWYGQNAVIRNEISSKLRTIFERYGFEPIETPIVETREAITFKGGGEIQKEVFQLSDQGKRELALRFDQTLPLARFVATHRDIKFPFKRYVIGPVFRDGPTQPDQGRYRQFTQCDVDTLGVKEMAAEAELFALAQDAFDSIGLGGVDVKINNKKLLYGILDYAGIPGLAKLRTIVTLDKIDKIGIEGVKQSLENLTLSESQRGLSNDTLTALIRTYDAKGKDALMEFKSNVLTEVGDFGYREIERLFETEANKSDLATKLSDYSTKGEILLNAENISKLLGVIQTSGDNEEVFQRLNTLVTSDRGTQGLNEIRQLLDYSKSMGFDFVRLEPSLARGLDYYTGTTIEVYLKDRSAVSSAILAGGRFDNMVGDFRGEGEIPAVGFSFGLERLVMAVKSKNPNMRNTNTQLYLIPIGPVIKDSLTLAHDLRKDGLNLDIEFEKRKMGKSIAYADSKGIPYVGMLGETEIAEKKLALKNLKSGEQYKIPFDEVSSFILNR